MSTSTATKKIALTGVLAALLIAGKWTLAAPNIEVVTLLLASFAFVFGPSVSILAAAAFVLEEAFAWGFNTWVLCYFIYWPLVAGVFSLLGFLVKKRGYLMLTVTATVAAVTLTAFFGVLSSLIDIGLFSGTYQNFWQRFSIMYGRGIVFFAVQIICNLVLFSIAFTPLVQLLSSLRQKLFYVASNN